MNFENESSRDGWNFLENLKLITNWRHIRVSMAISVNYSFLSQIFSLSCFEFWSHSFKVFQFGVSTREKTIQNVKIESLLAFKFYRPNLLLLWYSGEVKRLKFFRFVFQFTCKRKFQLKVFVADFCCAIFKFSVAFAKLKSTQLVEQSWSVQSGKKRDRFMNFPFESSINEKYWKNKIKSDNSFWLKPVSWVESTIKLSVYY